MNARCTNCNDAKEHNTNRGNRGIKLKDLRCSCGHRYEPMWLVRPDDDQVRAHPLYRNHNGVEYRWDIKNGKCYPNPPTVSI